jgi:hypothetical protein
MIILQSNRLLANVLKVFIHNTSVQKFSNKSGKSSKYQVSSIMIQLPTLRQNAWTYYLKAKYNTHIMILDT